MSDNRNDLPSTGANNFEQRVRETLMTYMGRQGDPMDRGITLRDLLDNGLVSLKDGAVLTNGRVTLPIKSGPAIKVDTTPDYTPPPTPTGFAVQAGYGFVMVEHDPANFVQGHGYLRTIVYGKTRLENEEPPVFADAVKLAEFSGSVFALVSDPATTWHLWIKWQTNDGVKSVDPAGGTNGLTATTAQDVTKLLKSLNGQITSMQLYSDLNKRIDLIDGPPTLDGSVAARLRAEATQLTDSFTSKMDTESKARQAAFEKEAQVRHDELIKKANELGAEITRVDTLRQTDSESFAGSIATFTAALDDASGAISEERRLRIEDGKLTATAITTLGGRVGSVEGWKDSEQIIRLQKDEAFQRDIESVRLTVNDPATGLVATRSTLLSEYITTIDSHKYTADQIAEFGGEVYDPVTGAVAKAIASGRIYTQLDANRMTQEKLDKLGGDLTDPNKGIIASALQNKTLLTKFDTEQAITREVTNTVSKFANPETGLINDASIQSTLFARSDAKSAMSEAITKYQSVNGKTISQIETTATTAASDADGLKSQYTVKVQSIGPNGQVCVAGFGLASTTTTAGANTSAFIVNADKFAVVASSGDGKTQIPITPFTVQTRYEMLEDGTTLKPGVYITNAFIQNGTIESAMIKKATINDAHILELNATKLTAGDGTIGGVLKSQNNNDDNTQGWRIEPNGNATFNTATIRGNVYATGGNIGGNIISADGIRSPNVASSSEGFLLHSSGRFVVGNITNYLKYEPTDKTLTYRGSLDVKGTGASRMEITDRCIKVYENGVLRVQIGDLSA